MYIIFTIIGEVDFMSNENCLGDLVNKWEENKSLFMPEIEGDEYKPFMLYIYEYNYHQRHGKGSCMTMTTQSPQTRKRDTVSHSKETQ